MLYRLAILGTMILLAGCGTSQHPTPAATTTTVTEEAAAALTDVYAERLRLGLGSPYRLIDAVMHDERLGDARAQVARDLLAQIADGDLYVISPLVFVAAGVPSANATAHLELINTIIEGAADPRVGELAVATAYQSAARDSVITPYVAGRAARVAALLRDRRLAQGDAQRLREASRRIAVAPEHLALTWRREKRFSVEQPTLAPLLAGDQREAARLAMLLSGGIRAAAQPVTGSLRRSAGLLKPAPHTGYAALAADTTTRFAQSALIITLRAIRATSHEPHLRVSVPHWQLFFENARDEESFIVEMADARQEDADDVVAAGITLDAAIALRPFAQETMAPVAAISLQELRSRFGVRVNFAKTTSAAERTSFLAMLTTALEDLRSVARTMEVQGLTFQVGPIAPNTRHLAFHDPRKRIIHIDPSAAAGTIAHEIAHDLDWQMSKRKYNTKSNYATDYAANNGRVLAYAVRELTAERALMGDPSEAVAAARPAEVFARRFEWYVASALALQGKSNGYLSPVQNDWITGYSSAIRPDTSEAAARSFADLVADATRMTRNDRANVIRIVVESASGDAPRVLLPRISSGPGAASPGSSWNALLLAR